MTREIEPFAVEVYRRKLSGETIEQLASDLGIPADRIAMRIQAASEYLRRRQKSESETGFRSSLVALNVELEENLSTAI